MKMRATFLDRSTGAVVVTRVGVDRWQAIDRALTWLYRHRDRSKVRLIVTPAILLILLLASSVSAQVVLTTSKPTYAPQESIVVSFSNAPGNAGDYIGLYIRGQAETGNWATMNTLQWRRTDGTSGVGTPNLKSGAVTFSGGLPIGSYEARFYPNDTTAPGAPKVLFAVAAPPVPIVGPNAVLVWSQSSTTGLATLQQILAWTYTLTSDTDAGGKTIVPTCTGAGEPYRCTTPVPPTTPGPHWIAVTTASPSTTVTSAQLSFTTQVLVSPLPASNLGIQD